MSMKGNSSKVLAGIAIAASGLALVISTAANAETTQTPDHAEQRQNFDKTAPAPQMNTDSLDATPNRFPLLLPQPTKIEQQNKYAVG